MEGSGVSVVIDGFKIAYRREGSGEPVLLVHGVTTSSFIWRRILPLLSPGHDVVVVDLLGCGESDRPAGGDYSPRRQAELLARLLDQLGWSRVHLVGHDVGGAVAQILAVEDPGRLLDLALLNTVAYDYWPVQPIITLRIPVLRHLAMASLDLGVLRFIVRRGLYHPERLTDELLALFRNEMTTSEGRRSFLQFTKCLQNRQLLEIADRLKTLPLPVLIVRGDADVYLTEEIALRLHREIPGSRLVRIPTAGHFIQEDEPELLARALLSFFAEPRDAR